MINFESRGNKYTWYSLPGKDYPGNDIGVIFGESQDSCTQQCINNPNCVAAVYSTSSGQCFPKTALGAPNDIVGLTLLVPPVLTGNAASMKVNLATDHPGDDFVSYAGAPISACGAVCSASGNNCTAYSGTSWGCYVKQSSIPVTTNPNGDVTLFY